MRQLIDIGDYLDYENCKCRKKLVDKPVKESTETNDKINFQTTITKCNFFNLRNGASKTN